MPIDNDDKKYYDFEGLNFESNCDIDNVIYIFFSKYNEIKGDKEYITYKIKNTIASDRKFLMNINGQGQDPLNRIGKVSYVRHDVIPEQNNSKEYYVYQIHSFITPKLNI
jgi:hypothetical protein